MEKLTEAQLKRLYFDYVRYRDSLAPMKLPTGAVEFYKKNEDIYGSQIKNGL